MDLPLVTRYLEGLAKDYIVAPRVWCYPMSIYPYGVSALLSSSTGRSKFVSPMAILGLTDEEIEVLLKDYMSLYLPLTGTRFWCIIPQTLATELNVTIGDSIYIYGLNVNLTVRGIMTVTQDIFKDFDGEYILPIDPSYSTQISRMEIPFTEETYPMPISIDNFMIMPWNLAHELGGYVSSVALIPKHKVSQETLMETGKKLAMSLDIPVYIGYNDTVVLLSRTITYAITGWEFVSVLLVLSIFSIVNVLLSSIQQRRREIYVYAALGLSPMGAALMFVIEAMTYATLGVVLGYLFGYGDYTACKAQQHLRRGKC